MRELVYRKAAVRDLEGIADYIIRERGDYDAALAVVDAPLPPEDRRLQDDA